MTKINRKMPSVLSRVRQSIIEDEKLQKGRMNEKDTIHHLIESVLGALGWDMNDRNQVRRDYSTYGHLVDIALFLDGSPTLFVEAKALKRSTDDIKWTKQTVDYANTEGVEWCVLTNGSEYRIYKTRAPGKLEKKLFEDVNIDIMKDDAQMKFSETVLSLLSPQAMKGNYLEKLWNMREIDRRVESFLGDMIETSRLQSYLKRKISENLKHDKISESLSRINFGISYPKIYDYIDNLVGKSGHQNNESPKTADHVIADDQQHYNKNMRTAEMVRLGLLPIGTVLTIKSKPGSGAKVIDGHKVEYMSSSISFNEWAKRVLGYSVTVYSYAVMPDGRTLDDLRRQADHSVGDYSCGGYLASRRRTSKKQTGKMIEKIPHIGTRRAKMQTPEMVRNGLLSIGTILSIKNHSGSEALVVSDRAVEYNGSTISFHEWGKRVIGSKVSIYLYATLPNGKTLEEVRKEFEQSNNEAIPVKRKIETNAITDKMVKNRKGEYTSNSRRNPKKIRTPEMVSSGLLPIGTVLTIDDMPGSEATVIDGKYVNYRGSILSFSKWGMKVKGWKTIQIYAHAKMPDGRRLGDLRK